MSIGQSDPSSTASGLLHLVNGARRGSTNSVNLLVQRCWPRIEQYVARRGAETPDALTNQVLAEFLLSLYRLTFESDQHVWSYLHRIAKSRLIDERRKLRAEHIPLDEDDVDVPVSESFDQQIADQLAVATLLDELTAEQQQVLQLRFIHDLSIEETGERMGKSVSAVKGLQYRAVAALADIVASIAH